MPRPHPLALRVGAALIALLPLCAAAQPEYSGRLPVGARPIAYNIRQYEAREFTILLRNSGHYAVRVEQRHINMVLYLKSEAGDTLRVADAQQPDSAAVLDIHTDTAVRYTLIAAPKQGIDNSLSGRFSIRVVRLNALGEAVLKEEE